MPYGKKMPKKMGCSGGGPNMYKMGSKENNSPMNFSNKAMKYMKNMPAMYGKPKMDGDPVKGKSKNPSTAITPIAGLPDDNKSRVKLMQDYRKEKGAVTPTVPELVTFAAEKKKKKQSVRRVTNEVRMKNAFSDLSAKHKKTNTPVTKKEIDDIRRKYDPTGKITEKMRKERKKKK